LNRPPVLVFVLAGAFLLLVVSLLIGAFTKPDFPPYRLTPAGARVSDGVYTLDASRADRWQFFSFARNAVVDSGSWDVAFRRNHVITAPGAGAQDLGLVSFDSVADVPLAGGGYQTTTFGADTTNPGIGKWYAYSMFSHLLTSKHHVYAVRTADGRYAKLEILAYYCREVGSACYTMRYKATRPRSASAGAHQ
jgi:heme-binding HmuY-like protein